MLHLDLWHGGRNVFADGGSYQYNEPRGWGKHLKETSGHNTLEVDDRSQMKLASTFLYVDWTKAKVLDSGALIPGWSGEGVEGEHYSYLEPSGVVHRRTVLRRGESVLVIDDALPAGDRPWAGTLRWHFGDSAHWAGEADGPRLTARCDGLVVDVFGPEGAGATLLRGEDHLPETGRSRTYAAIDAFAVLAMRRERAPGAARWITAFGTEALTVQGDDLLWEGLRVPRGPGERPAPE